MAWTSLKRRTWEILEVAEPDDRPSWLFDIAIRLLIALNVLVVVIETIPEAAAFAGEWFRLFDLFSVAVFSVEYLGRVWSCTSDERYRQPVAGRIRFALTPLALIDLFAVLPFWLPMTGLDLRILRGVRLFRIFRILKIARYSRALRTFGRVFRSQSEELALTFALVAFLVLIASSLLYFAENPAQPDVFSSVPAAMWWGVVTLTTVGYGDVYPVTILGRVLGGVFALTAVLLIALPTAILGAAFVDELRREGDGGRVEAAAPSPPEDGDPQRIDRAVCPHCGRRLTEEPKAT